MGKRPLISCISVCYNEDPGRIVSTLESIRAQSIGDLELIIIDGGSSIATVAILKEYADPSHVLSEKDSGVYDAMNKGLRMSQGHWIVFMNIGDRFASPETLSDAMSAIENIPGYSWYYGDCYGEQGKQNLLSCMPRRYTALESFHRVICHQAVLTKRELFEKLGPFDLSFKVRADHAFQRVATRSGFFGCYIPVPICYYEFGGLSSDADKSREELFRIQMRFFSMTERTLFTTIWILRKFMVRLKLRNLSLPLALRRFLNRRWSDWRVP